MSEERKTHKGGRGFTKPEDKVVVQEDSNLHVTTEVMAVICNVSAKTLIDWHKKGCPKLERGWWSVKDVFAWLKIKGRANAEDHSEVQKAESAKRKAEIRIKRARAKRCEIEVKALMGKYHKKEVVQAAWAQRAQLYKTALMNGVKTLPPILEGRPLVEIESELDRAFRSMLEDVLANGQYTDTEKYEEFLAFLEDDGDIGEAEDIGEDEFDDE